MLNGSLGVEMVFRILILTLMLACSNKQSEKSAPSSIKEGDYVELGIKLSDSDQKLRLGEQVLHDVIYRVHGCESKFELRIRADHQSNLNLYKSDRECRLMMESFRLGERLFVPEEETLDHLRKDQIYTYRSGNQRRIYVLPKSELPSPLTEDLDLEFVLLENNFGGSSDLELEQVSLELSQTRIYESTRQWVALKIARSISAKTAMKIRLAFSGDARIGEEILELPNEFELSEDETERIHLIEVSKNFDGDRFLEISLAEGSYLPRLGKSSVRLDLVDSSSQQVRLEFLGVEHFETATRLWIENKGRLDAKIKDFNWKNSVLKFTSGSYPGRNASCGELIAAQTRCSLELEAVFSDSYDEAAIKIDDGKGELALELKLWLQARKNPSIVLSKEVLDFKSQAIGGFQTRSVRISNSGNLAIEDLKFSLVQSEQFFLNKKFPSCAERLEVGASCWLHLSFFSSEEGSFQDELKVTASFTGGETKKLSLALQGVSEPLAHIIPLSSDSLEFTGNRASLVVRNIGSQAAKNLRLKFNENYLKLKSTSCTRQLNIDQVCSFELEKPNRLPARGLKVLVQYNNFMNYSAQAIFVREKAEVYEEKTLISWGDKHGLALEDLRLDSLNIHPSLNSKITVESGQVFYQAEAGFQGQDSFKIEYEDLHGIVHREKYQVWVAPRLVYIYEYWPKSFDRLLVEAAREKGFSVALVEASSLDSNKLVWSDLVALSPYASTSWPILDKVKVIYLNKDHLGDLVSADKDLNENTRLLYQNDNMRSLLYSSLEASPSGMYPVASRVFMDFGSPRYSILFDPNLTQVWYESLVGILSNPDFIALEQFYGDSPEHSLLVDEASEFNFKRLTNQKYELNMHLGIELAEGPLPTGCSEPSWQYTKLYRPGDIVSYNGSRWKANWYTRSIAPGSYRLFSLWEKLGDCRLNTQVDDEGYLEFSMTRCELEGFTKGLSLRWYDTSQRWSVFEDGQLLALSDFYGFDVLSLIVDSDRVKLSGLGDITQSIAFSNKFQANCMKIKNNKLEASRFRKLTLEKLKIQVTP